MTRKQNSAKQAGWKEVMGGQEDFLRPLIREVLQQVMEAEMEEALGADKSEGTSSRVGYRSGDYGRTLVTRVASLNCGCPRTGRGGFEPRSSNATNVVRRR